MKKSKILLLFSLLFLFLISFFKINQLSLKEEKIKEEGTIIEKSEYDTYASYTVKGKEKYIITSNDVTLNIGDIIKIEGTKEIPNENTNFYLFNYQTYLRSKNIFYIIKNPKITFIKENNTIRYKLKKRIINKIETYQYKEYFYLYIYGENHLDNNLYETIKTLGIMHLLALSGMHIDFFLKFLKKKWLIITFLICYLLLVKPSYSILRAGISEMIYQLSNKKLNKKTILIILFSIFIFINPFVIYNFGFQLSFLISYFLKIDKISYLIDTLKVSIQAFLLSMPLCINNFFYLNFLTPILNLFYVPFISFIFFPTIVITFLIKKLEPIFNIEVKILETSIYFFSKFDFAIVSFGYLKIIPFMLFVIIIFIILNKKKGYFLLILFLILHYNQLYLNPTLTVTLLDVGQGDSILITLPYTSKAILIDTGGKYNTNMTDKILVPSLKARGIHTLKYLILTHGDLDHMGEAENLINNFKIDTVILNKGDDSTLETSLIQQLEKKKIGYSKNIKEITFQNIKLDFLNTTLYDNENDNSNVIYFNYHNFKFLLMGDASEKREKDILEKYNLKDIDVLKVGHHGSKTSSSEYFINTVTPKYALISVGSNNKYGHPHQETLNRLKNSKIYRTDQNGSIEIKINKTNYKMKTCVS